MKLKIEQLIHLGGLIVNKYFSNPQAIWRHYQYQQLYNLAQKKMRDSSKDFCFYVGLAFVKKEYRKSGGGAEFYPSIIEVGRYTFISEK